MPEVTSAIPIPIGPKATAIALTIIAVSALTLSDTPSVLFLKFWNLSTVICADLVISTNAGTKS